MVVFNVIFILISWYVANVCFARGMKFYGWLNLFASAFNGAILAMILFT